MPYPTLILNIAAGLIWAASLAVVFSHGKFRRKWWWVVLTLLVFQLSLPLGDAFWAPVTIPIGAIYVLLFALFGPRASRKAPGRLAE
jgi:hypothetical protein